MLGKKATRAWTAHVIVVGNEKGGSGKSTIAMHIAVALIKSNQSLATIDLDSRQRSLTHYIENRRAWAKHLNRNLRIPDHLSLGENDCLNGAAGCEALAYAIHSLGRTYSVILIDTPGHYSDLSRLAHSVADTIITPLNDSFVDFDVLGTVHPKTFVLTGTSHYAQMVEETRHRRQLADHVIPDWIVLRNRLSMLGSHNKRFVGEALHELSQRLNFRTIEGLAERVIFREFYPRGLTAVDELYEATLGTRPTMSHFTARMEVEALLSEMRLSDPMARMSRERKRGIG